jgi:hypothetical protein
MSVSAYDKAHELFLAGVPNRKIADDVGISLKQVIGWAQEWHLERSDVKQKEALAAIVKDGSMDLVDLANASMEILATSIVNLKQMVAGTDGMTLSIKDMLALSKLSTELLALSEAHARTRTGNTQYKGTANLSSKDVMKRLRDADPMITYEDK